jgi:hypothetical protein
MNVKKAERLDDLTAYAKGVRDDHKGGGEAAGMGMKVLGMFLKK